MQTLVEMARDLRRGRVSPTELVRQHLDRMAADLGCVNAFVTVLADQAMDRARQLEAGPREGALWGVPVSVKDSLDMEGQPTYCGSRLRLDHRAGRDSVVVERLRAAGAVILGKTNTPEFLANYETDNHVCGRTNNPHDRAKTAGGSSGGEAAAIAAGFSAGGVGSDGGGSVRFPAHCCGIAGLKPTPGRIPASGHVPPIHHPGGLLGVVGPMARTAEDVRVLYRVLEGYHPSDPFSVPHVATPATLDGVRVGVMEQFLDVPVQPAIRAAVLGAAKAVERMGFAVEPYRPAGVERAPNVWSFFFTELAAPFTREMIAGKEDQTHPTGTEFYDKVKDKPDPTGTDVVRQLAERDAMRHQVLQDMPDIVVAPAAGVSAFPHGARRYDVGGGNSIGLFQATMPLVWVNLLGLPAMVVPWGRDESGMPVGVQLIAHPWFEERLLEFAVRLLP